MRSNYIDIDLPDLFKPPSPESSGPTLYTYKLEGVEHQEAYRDAKAIGYVVNAVRI